MISLSANKLQELYTEYWSAHPNTEAVETKFCSKVETLIEAENLRSEDYEDKICWLHEYCEQKIRAELVAKAIGCSLSYARRFSYTDERGAFQKDWSKSNQNAKVSPGARTKIINRDGNACLRCGIEAGDDLEVHHILPISQGGTNDDENLATLCERCHEAAHSGSKTTAKTAYTEGKFQAWLRESDEDVERSADGSITARQKRLSEF